ncbi:hypothetical protein Zmor_006744 [Zophobas morio]|uniref:Zinc finger PHD-type domain-containing protein n=1 Tax=Zophobas morio TaxID=2755281 RepID=A0AA38MNT8_9CUCU|nr:hypothetical protein Zmor_006744 [Zophobas morio]
MNPCANCGSDTKSSNSTSIPCDVCHGMLHLNCVGLSDTDIKFTRTRSKSLKVVCNSCNNNMTQFKDVKTLISALQAEFTASINSLKLSFETQLNDLKASFIPKQELAPTLFEDLVGEVIDRQSRKQNLILFGLPEQSSSFSRDQVPELDRVATIKILKAMDSSYDNDHLQVQRLGRPSSEKTRPLKVTLRSEKEVTNFIKRVKYLRSLPEYKNISISFDRTQKQNQYYKQGWAKYTFHCN